MKYLKKLDIERYYFLLINPAVILAVGAVLLSAVSFSGTPIGGDESNWLITAKMWVDDGLIPYRDIITNKTPGIFIVNYISFALFGSEALWFVRFLGVLATLLTILAIYYVVRKICNNRAAAFAAWIYILIMPLDVVDGAFVQTETFMNLFRMLSFAVVFLEFKSSREQNHRSYLLVLLGGLSFGLAISFKQIAIFDALPLVFGIWWLVGQNMKTTMRHVLWFFCGATVATFLSIIPILVSGGTISDYFNGAWAILFSSVPIKSSILGRISGFVKNYFEHNLFPVIIGIVSFVSLRRNIGQHFAYVWPLIVWAFADFLAYNAQGQYFNHHHKVFLLSGVIIFGVTVDFLMSKIWFESAATGDVNAERDSQNHGRRQKTMGAIFIIALLLYFVPFQPDYFYAIRNRIKNLYPNDAQMLGREIQKMTDPDNLIYVWGDVVGQLYFYSDRRPASRQIFQAFLDNQNALIELREDIIKNKPSVILIPDTNPEPSWLAEIIRKDYSLHLEKYGFRLYNHGTDNIQK